MAALITILAAFWVAQLGLKLLPKEIEMSRIAAVLTILLMIAAAAIRFFVANVLAIVPETMLGITLAFVGEYVLASGRSQEKPKFVLLRLFVALALIALIFIPWLAALTRAERHAFAPRAGSYVNPSASPYNQLRGRSNLLMALGPSYPQYII